MSQTRRISEQTGLRFVGPNVQGINYVPNKLCAMFFPVIRKKGPLGIITQSGSATAALSEWAEDEGLGISAAINCGNQVDLCESDYIGFLSNDAHTKAIALYVEGVKDGGKFLETIQTAARMKPIVILKSGRSVSGEKAVSSHTGSLAGNHRLFSSACRQLGVVTAETIEALYDYAKALATIKEPRGNRILSVATSGGMGALAADEAEKEGLSVARLSDEFIKGLKDLEISPFVSMANPLDLGYVAAEEFRRVGLLAEKCDVADIILLNIGDPVPGITEVATDLQKDTKASVVVSYLGGGDEEKKGRLRMLEGGIPVFRSPERAVKGLGAAVWYAAFKKKSPNIPTKKFLPSVGKLNEPDSRTEFILEPDAIKVLNQYGINYVHHGVAISCDEALSVAEKIGYPVVMKIVSKDILHKSDVGGVITGLRDAREAKRGFDEVIARVRLSAPKATIGGVLVCKEAPRGLDVIVGVTNDPVLGPAIMFGLGGIFAEVMQDVSFRLPPLERRDAEEMIREIRGYSLFEGIRGQQGYDISSLTDMLLSVSDLVCKRPQVAELDINPVRLLEKGLMVLDVRLIEASPIERER